MTNGVVLVEGDVSALLRGLVLEQGPHARREDGLSLMEAVAWISGLPHSSEPACVDPVLIRACSCLNDRWDSEDRQKLLRFVVPLAGTYHGGGLSKRRAYFIIDCVIRSVFSTFLRELPGKSRPDLADRLEKLPAVFDRSSAEHCRDELLCLPIWADVNEAAVRSARSNEATACSSEADTVTEASCVFERESARVFERTVGAVFAVAAAAVRAAFFANAISGSIDYIDAADGHVFSSNIAVDLVWTAMAVVTFAAGQDAAEAFGDLDIWQALHKRVQDRMLDVLQDAIKLTSAKERS